MAAQTETVKFLPIQLIEGYGPFNPGFSSIDNSSKESALWAKTYSDVKGIPAHWSKTQVCHIWLNTHQFVYQNVLAGNISQLDYKELQKGWNWLPDTTKLSETPIKCYIYVIKGFDETTQKWSVMVDANNNLDFGDETTIYPESITKDSHNYKQATSIQYEVYQRGQVRKAKIPIVFKMAESELLYNFPQYASVTLKKGNKEYNLSVSSGFTRPDFETTGLVNPSTPFSAKKVVPRDLIKINDIIEIDHVSYRGSLAKRADLYGKQLSL
jgi:hypothetical protein